MWAEDPQRLEWHKEVSEEYEKCKADSSYSCAPSFLTKAARFGPCEICLQTPYRGGVCHKFPWNGLALCEDCFDPLDFTDADETELVDNGKEHIEIRPYKF